jgi:cholesterol transport system auxiliary component
MAPPPPRPRWRRRRVLLLATGLPLLAGGCVSLAQGQAPRRFRLTNPTRFPPDLPAVDWTLEIDQTAADPGIDTTRIARLDPSGLELQYYADAEWPSKAADMVNTLLLQSFVDSARVPRVGDRNSGLRPDFLLKTVLRDFQAEGGGAPNVKVAMTASLVQLPRRLQVGAERFQSTAPAGAGSIEEIVRAFDQALQRVLAEIVAWTLTTGRNARPTG